jgi:hypothetical protein
MTTRASPRDQRQALVARVCRARGTTETGLNPTVRSDAAGKQVVVDAAQAAEAARWLSENEDNTAV